MSRPTRIARRFQPGAALAALAIAAACGTGPEDSPAVGTLERERIELIAEQQEPILEIPVSEGQTVEAGELVVRMDDARLGAELAAAESSRDAAAARLAELSRGTRREEVEQGRARLREAESLVAEAVPELERVRALAAQGIDSRRALERATAALETATSRRDAARAELTRLLNGATPEELDAAAALLAEAEARVTEIRLRKERLNVRAPRSGRVDALPFEIGERPPPGATVAVLLAGEAPYARVYLPAGLRPEVRAGTPARVRVQGVERTYQGRVRWVASDATFTPFFALTERDRGRLAYLAEVDLLEPAATSLATGLPVEVIFRSSGAASATVDE